MPSKSKPKMPVLHLIALLREWERVRGGGGVRRARRRPRIYRPRLDILGLTDTQCIQRFRLDREAIIYLCRLLDDQLCCRSNNPQNIPVIIKVTTALSVLASGSFQRVAGDVLHISQASVSRCVTQFLDAMLQHISHFIKFPDTPAERRRYKGGFYRVAGFPSVVGAIDCTHVAIRAPSANENVYTTETVDEGTA